MMENIYTNSEKFKNFETLNTASKQIPRRFACAVYFWLASNKPKITTTYDAQLLFSHFYCASSNMNIVETWSPKRSLHFLSKHICFDPCKTMNSDGNWRHKYNTINYPTISYIFKWKFCSCFVNSLNAQFKYIFETQGKLKCISHAWDAPHKIKYPILMTLVNSCRSRYK